MKINFKKFFRVYKKDLYLGNHKIIRLTKRGIKKFFKKALIYIILFLSLIVFVLSGFVVMVS